MIDIKDLRKSFGGAEVLKGVNLCIAKGEVLGLIGRSGYGKSVLLKHVVGLMKPDMGRIAVDGKDISTLSGKALSHMRSRLGFLFQGGALFDSMTVEENIRFPMDMFTNKTAKEKLDRVNYCLERVNLERVNHKYPAEISGGMQKRVGIARSIVLDPKYLFCDEPNSGLDPKTSILIDELIQSITREHNITTIINTHDMNSVMEIGEHIALLNQGRLEWEGKNTEVMQSDNEELHDFIFASPFLKKLKERAI